VSGPEDTEDITADPTERFYRGTIVKVDFGRRTGLLRTGNGREVRFVVPFVEILDGRSFDDLSEGASVGFDLGWTSRGLRVTRIKIDS
jgi:hypothetical protein